MDDAIPGNCHRGTKSEYWIKWLIWYENIAFLYLLYTVTVFCINHSDFGDVSMVTGKIDRLLSWLQS